jgi:hypothetical protein
MDFETKLKNELFCFLQEKNYDRIINIVKLEILEREKEQIIKDRDIAIKAMNTVGRL